MKKIIVAAILLFLSVNIFPLIPWQVTLYQGERVAIFQSPGRTELRQEPNKQTEEAPSWDGNGENVGSLLDKLFRDGDDLRGGNVYRATRYVMLRLDKIYIPVLPGGDAVLTEVGWNDSGMVFCYQNANETESVITICGDCWCLACDTQEMAYAEALSKGETEDYLVLGGMTARLRDEYTGKVTLFGEKSGTRFHATIYVGPENFTTTALSGFGFEVYYPTHSALLPYWLAEAGRIACAAAFLAGIVLLVLGLLPLRKKQTIPDG